MIRLLCLLCALLVVARPALGDEPAARSSPGESSISEHLGKRLPLHEQFVSTEGGPLELGAVLGRGKPGLLVLAYNRCAMLCSLVLRGTAETVRKLGLRPGEDFALVTISIDPTDTPDEARRTQTTALEQAGYAGEA